MSIWQYSRGGDRAIRGADGAKRSKWSQEEQTKPEEPHWSKEDP